MAESNRYREWKRLLTLSAIAFLLLASSFPVARAAQANYYVDSISGSDSNSGTSESSAWRTLAPVHAHDFLPGDTIHLRRGSAWDGGLAIDHSGTEGNPITLTSYGSGAKPTIRRPDVTWGRAVQIDADWVVVEGLLVRDAHEAGVFISDGSDHNIVRDCEATNVGIGVAVHGQHNLVNQNYVHDLAMVVNTPGGDDDYGAVGVWLFNSNNEVSYNTMLNCIAPSYDYGSDGGAVESWGVVHNSYIHHNWAQSSEGFMEVAGGSVRNTMVAYNVAVGNGRFGTFHLGGHFLADVQNFRIENNSIVETGAEEMEWAVTAFIDGAPAADTVIMRNNVVHVDRFWLVANNDGFTHEHNLYYLASPDLTTLGFELQEGEQLADALFVDLPGHDFRLQPDSPAIDAGAYLGYPVDYDDNAVPLGAATDIGAYEYVGEAPSETPTPTPIPTNTPVPPTATPSPTPDPDELIIDDSDSGFATSFSQDSWTQYTAVGGQHYGDTHHYNGQAGAGLDVATWSFTVPRPGTYAVHAWWWEGTWRPTDVPYTISHSDGSTTTRVNQQANGGQWNLLGVFAFLDQGSVTVSDDVSSEGTDIAADAIKLAYVGPLPTNTPTPPPTSTPILDVPTVARVSPDHGPAGEGMSVSVFGSNFRAGATVTFGGVACDSVTVISVDEIACTAPPQLPAVVDVAITNAHGETGTLLRGFTYWGTTAVASLSLVGGEIGPSGLATIVLKLDAGEIPVYSLDLVIDYSPLDAVALSVEPGPLSGDMAISHDLTTDGQVRLALAGDSPTSGRVELLTIAFQMAEPSGAGTPVLLSRGEVNEGSVPVSLGGGYLGRPPSIYLPLVVIRQEQQP